MKEAFKQENRELEVYCDISTSWLGQDGCQFVCNIFKCIFFNENHCILIRFAPKIAPDSIGSADGLVMNKWQIMTWTNDDWALWCRMAPLALNAAG